MQGTMALFSHPACADHDTGPGHPERAERLRAVERALAAPRFAALDRREAPRATRAQLERIHAPAAVERTLRRDPPARVTRISTATPSSPPARARRRCGRRGRPARRWTRSSTAKRGARSAPSAPPGHHAEPDRAMGFCLFNNAAIGAAHALAAHGLQRVAVLDFDVHHGNGTQAAFKRDARTLFVSSHQSPLYPGTGAASETGVGNIVNMPLAAGAEGDVFRAAWEGAFDRVDAFHPELIVVSAGFDAHRRDPLAGLALVEEDFAWISRRIAEAADSSCAGRVVSTLEGGYDLEALAASAAAHRRGAYGMRRGRPGKALRARRVRSTPSPRPVGSACNGAPRSDSNRHVLADNRF